MEKEQEAEEAVEEDDNWRRISIGEGGDVEAREHWRRRTTRRRRRSGGGGGGSKREGGGLEKEKH